MNGFRRLQTKLREEGWFVGWNLPCCQSCAWAELPDEFEDGTQVDLSKVLFNHSQDCEVDYDLEDCEECEGEGCDACDEEGVTAVYPDGDWDRSIDGFVCYTPEQQNRSSFCFAGDKPGVKNLKAIIPIIEECGCSIHWNGKGGARPEISWEE